MKIERIQLPPDNGAGGNRTASKIEAEEKNTLGKDAVAFDLQKRKKKGEQYPQDDASKQRSEEETTNLTATDSQSSSNGGSSLDVVV